MKYIIGSIIALIITSVLILRYNKKTSGIVIVLNGPSASGKSSIQKEFQKLMMPDLWIKVGIDNLFDTPMPDITPENMHYWQSSNPIRWVEQSKDGNGNNIVSLLVGEQGEKIAYGMNNAIVAYAKNGCNVIVDYIAYKPEWLIDLRDKLKGMQVYYVSVQIPLEILEAREEARGTSPKGHARSHYHTVLGNDHYDLFVDSEKYTAQEIAQQIKNLLHK